MSSPSDDPLTPRIKTWGTFGIAVLTTAVAIKYVIYFWLPMEDALDHIWSTMKSGTGSPS